MRALSLFGVLILAHLLILPGRHLPLSAWTPIALIWQDVLVALVFAALDVLLKRSRALWVLYGALVVYAAINVPIARVLSSPLTMPMLRAARGPLRDSIAYYFTPVYLGEIALVLFAGVLFPFLLGRLRFRSTALVAIAGVVIVAAGPLALSKVETEGLHRNAVGALIPVRLPNFGSAAAVGDWRTSPFPVSASEPDKGNRLSQY